MTDDVERAIRDVRGLLSLLEGNQRALVQRVCALETAAKIGAVAYGIKVDAAPQPEHAPPTRADTPYARKTHAQRDADVVKVREQRQMPCCYDEALRDAWEAGERHAARRLRELGIEVVLP